MPSVSIGLSLRGQLNNSVYSPNKLFASSEQGVWYDPSQINTLFQDSAGTTPVTAPNQPVGLMLDKSKNGIGANGASCRNLLTYTEQFDNAIWIKVRSSISANVTTAPDGTITADKLVEDTSATNSHPILSTVNILSGQTYTWSAYAKAVERSRVQLSTNGGGGFCTFNLQDGTIAGGTGVITNVGGGWYRCSITYVSNTTSEIAYIWPVASGTSNSYTGDGTSGVYIWGAQLELGSTATAYQPITSSWAATIAGNHATQATSTQRPIYGINPITGTRNLLTYTEQFDNAVWNKANISISANASTAPDGSLTADLATSSSAAGYIYPNSSIFAAAGGNTYTHSVYIKAGTATSIQLLVAAAATYTGTYNLSTGVASTATANTTVSMVDAGGGWYRCIITCGSVANNAYTELQMGRVANGLTFSIWGAQLEQSATATAYQKVVSQYEVTEAGVQSASYLAFDGVDDGMVTGTITPATDKVQVFAGVRKLSDALSQTLAETSVAGGSNPGSITVLAPAFAGDYFFRAYGTIGSSVSTSTSFPAPITNVLAGIGDISTDTMTIRINSTQSWNNTADQGIGNFNAYPLYLGRRAGTSNPFNGRLYSLIVRFGANLTTGQITSTESWVNGKTGAY